MSERNDHSAPRQHGFSSRLRVQGSGLFLRLRKSPVRKTSGPLTIYGLPNELDHPRLGLSVARSVGTAPRRTRIKRLVRESFRLLQHDLPGGYDLLVSVRPHAPLPLAEYQRILITCTQSIHKAWSRKSRPSPDDRPEREPSR